MDAERIDQLRDLVATVRKQRALTLAAAANLTDGKLSSETWRRFENGQGELTKRVREGVALAFGWELTWPEQPPAVTEVSPREDQVMAMLSSLTEEVRALRAELRSLTATPTPRRPVR